VRFPRRTRPDRLSRQLAEWEDETQAGAGEWLELLKGDDPPDPGAPAKAGGWVNIDDACLDLSGDKPEFQHVSGCRCLVAIGPEGEHRH